MDITGSTLFSGGEGVGVGMRAAGIRHLQGLEWEDAIASVARLNGFNTKTGDGRSEDYSAWERPTILHASPVCKNASNAKANGTESAEDIETADAVCRAIVVMRPRCVTLENVWGYRKFDAFKNILKCLKDQGYQTEYWHLNSADFGGWVLCPIHDKNITTRYASDAGETYHVEIAPDIVEVVAMMRSEDQAMHLAWDVVANLVKATNLDIAVNAMRQWLEKSQVENQENKTHNGRVEELLTNEDMSKFVSRENTIGSIEWLLNLCSDANYLKTKWFTIRTEIWQITAQIIYKCLQTMVSTWDSTTPNAASHECPLCKFTAVPQTRKRLILVAALDFKPYRPQPTHDKKNYGGFSDIKRWVGWYEAIEDLIPTLPESKFANWQLARLPKHLTDVLIGGGNRSQSFLEFEKEHRPDTPGKRLRDQPSQTVSATASGDMRAFLMDGLWGRVREIDKPSGVILSTSGSGRDKARAFIVNTREQHAGGDVTAVEGDKPVDGLVASSSPSRHKAFLVNESSTMEIRPAPAATQVANERNGGQGQRAWLDSGRVVKMTPRALARFQSFPDSYILPEKTHLACEIIGNAVPCLLYQRVIESQVDLFK